MNGKKAQSARSGNGQNPKGKRAVFYCDGCTEDGCGRRKCPGHEIAPPGADPPPRFRRAVAPAPTCVETIAKSYQRKPAKVRP